MPPSEFHPSLLSGRNVKPLDENEIRRGCNTFLGLDDKTPVRYDPNSKTKFRVAPTNDGSEHVAEIVFGPDLYPGSSTVDANSSLSIRAAAAHELSHYNRWYDKTELQEEHLLEIDEALTSLDATIRFQKHLSDHEVRQLVADAMQRLQRYVRDLSGGDELAKEPSSTTTS